MGDVNVEKADDLLGERGTGGAGLLCSRFSAAAIGLSPLFGLSSSPAASPFRG